MARPVSPPSAGTTLGERRRAAFEAFMAERGLRAHPWAEAAGVASNNLYNYIKGATDSMAQATIDALAAAAGVQPAEMFGENADTSADVAISHSLREDVLVPLGRSGGRVAVPQETNPARLRVASVQNGGMMPFRTGALIFWHDSWHKADRLLGRLCCIATDKGLMLGELRRGPEPGVFVLVSPSGRIHEVRGTKAAPIDWIRPHAE